MKSAGQVVVEDGAKVFLLARFRAFYDALQPLLEQISARTRLRPDAATEVDGELLAKVRKELVIALKAPLDAAKQAGINASSESFRRVRFLMAEYADQQVIAVSGVAEAEWPSLTTEVDTPLYPGLAGLDRLLDEQDPAQVGLAKVYLAALTLGWRVEVDSDDPERMAKEQRVENYRAALFRFIERVEPPPEDPVPLFPEAYRRTQSASAPDHLPALRGWVWALVIAAALVLLASFPIWWQVTSGAETLLERILAALSAARA